MLIGLKKRSGGYNKHRGDLMRGAIFDVDGTLLDSMTVWWDVLIDFFKECGQTLSDSEALEYYDMTLEASIPLMKRRLGIDMSPAEISERLKYMAGIAYAETIPLKDGAGEYLRNLKNGGIKIAVATSGFKELCRKAFARLGVLDCIDAYAFSEEVGVDKSHPDVYLLAAKRIGIPPEECVVYEDIRKGIEGAKKGGFKTCAIFDPTNIDETEILKKTADRYITCWHELL